MADDDEKGQDEKKEKEKAETASQQAEIKRNASIVKKKTPSKTGMMSKSSLKKVTDSALSMGSETSDTSFTMKRQSEMEKMSKAPKYQNTYRLDSKKPFKPDLMYKALETIVLREVDDFPSYDSFFSPKLAQTIAGEIRNFAKAQNFDRYKICVLVYLGEKKFQGFQAAFRALWDQERDGWTTYFYESRSYFISCTCYGLYHD